jgi:hypothetical protein
LGKWRQEDHKFETRLDYIASSRIAWTMYQDLVSKKKKKNQKGDWERGSNVRALA